MTPDEHPDTVHGYEKDLDWDRELSYAKEHEDDRRTQVHAEVAPGGWWVHALETDHDGEEELAAVDLGTHTRAGAIKRVMDFMEHNPLGLSPTTRRIIEHEQEKRKEAQP